MVDTEEEFDWDAPFDPASTSVENIACQELAQLAFDEYGVVPTYAVDYPVASTAASVAVLKRFQDEGRCEIGAHLHPWVNPPQGEAVNAFNSYACNLPGALMRAKLEVLTRTIERNFGRPPAVYKAGRYGVDAATPAVLAALGYRADASVVPHTEFRADGGPDFRGFPDQPFLVAPGLVEVPLSVHFVGAAAAAGSRLYGLLSPWLRLRGIAARLGVLERMRLSPEGHDLDDLVRQTKAALARGDRYFALTYHSSSLLPGGSPYARTAHERDVFLRTLTQYVQFFFALPEATATTVRALADGVLQGGGGEDRSYAPRG
ncbi:MAG: hypothetical protein NVSMB18_12290 [Acetobacteraceae bacterium]